MKRLNPETGLPFKQGFIREDGKVFKSYRTKDLKKDGFFAEEWVSKEKLKSLQKYRTKFAKDYRKTTKGRAKILIAAAKERGVVTITEDWLEEKLKKGVCELTNLPFDFKPSTKTSKNPFSPSLDRIDSSNLIYSKFNTRVVLSSVNFALNEFGLETMRPIFKELAKL